MGIRVVHRLVARSRRPALPVGRAPVVASPDAAALVEPGVPTSVSPPGPDPARTLPPPRPRGRAATVPAGSLPDTLRDVATGHPPVAPDRRSVHADLGASAGRPGTSDPPPAATVPAVAATRLVGAAPAASPAPTAGPTTGPTDGPHPVTDPQVPGSPAAGPPVPPPAAPEPASTSPAVHGAEQPDDPQRGAVVEEVQGESGARTSDLAERLRAAAEARTAGADRLGPATPPPRPPATPVPDAPAASPTVGPRPTPAPPAPAPPPPRSRPTPAAAPVPPPVVIGTIEVITPAAPAPGGGPLEPLASRRRQGRARWSGRER